MKRVLLNVFLILALLLAVMEAPAEGRRARKRQLSRSRVAGGGAAFALDQ